MKILHLLTQASGGPADHVADVAPVQASRGHDVAVVMPEGAAAQRVSASGVRRIAVSVRTKADARGALDLVRVLRHERPDVLHCQDRRAGLAGRLAARLAGLPAVVFTLHGAPDGLAHLVRGNLRVAPERRRDRFYYLYAERRLARRTARIVSPSHALADFLVHHVGVPRDQVDVVPNGVDLTRFTPGTPGASTVWLGLMEPVKRLDVLLDAAALVPDLKLVLAGDGPLRSWVAGEVSRRGLDVSMPGFVADPATLLASARAFVLPSAAENCPLSLLQAMASGVPVVASRVGGIPEVVRDGIDGLLVPPGDVGALAAALRAVEPAMGRAARERVENGWSIEHCADGLLDVYARAVR